jgi:acyl-coenzyme A thioesterase 13
MVALVFLMASQTVHGGLIMSLTDTLGSLALATRGQYMTGVSTDIGL